MLESGALVQAILAGMGINLLVAFTAYRAGSVSRSGAVAGFLLGSVIYAAAGPGAYLLLLLFFVTGTIATKVGYRKKLEAGIAQEKGGARGWPHAIANAGGPALLALGVALSSAPALFLVGYTGALATATGDTTSSEIGKAFGRRTFLLTTFRAVPAGTTGAASLEGTAAGILGAVLVALVAAALSVIQPEQVGFVVLAGFLGFMIEGIIGTVFESRGLLNNEHVNFLNTILGGALAMTLVATFGSGSV